MDHLHNRQSSCISSCCIDIDDQKMWFVIYLCLINMEDFICNLRQLKVHARNVLVSAFIQKNIFPISLIILCYCDLGSRSVRKSGGQVFRFRPQSFQIYIFGAFLFLP